MGNEPTQRGGSMIPPDIKNQIDKSRPRAPGGIGAGAPENALSARAREQALNPDGVDLEDEQAPAADAEHVDYKTCPNTRCAKPLVDEWNYCSKCGADLIRGGAAKRIGITITDDDLQSYIFRGYITKELSFLGKHKITVRSSVAQDSEAVDDYLMNGSWRKKKVLEENATPEQRQISDFYFRQVQSLAVTACCVHKIDGQSIGDTMEKRIAYLQERGSAMVDMLSSRTVIFNQAVTEHLQRSDALLGS